MTTACRSTLPCGPRARALAAALFLIAAPARAGAPPAEPAPPAAQSDRLERDGLVIDFSLRRAGASEGGGALREGDYAEIAFRATDASSGRPVAGLRPSAWMDMAGVVGGRAGEERDCKDRVALYLRGSVGIRPLVDLNGYYLLVLNQDPSISVIDPVVSMTGATSLYATIVLKRAAADWAKSADDKRLYVSTPAAGEVAVVDAERFGVLETVRAGKNPVRVALQADGRLLWVGNDSEEESESGVTVIDVDSRKVVAFVKTGRGHHEIAFSAGDARAFVTNRGAGTVSVIDVARLEKIADLATGPVPISIAYSPLSQAIYVADGKAGTIAVVDPLRPAVTARLRAAPGLGPMRFSPDGRFGFAVNPARGAVHVVDAAERRLVHELAVGGRPYQVSFTRAFAYVRLLDSATVKMVNLLSLGAGGKPMVQGFAAGIAAPEKAGRLSIADSVAPAAGDAAVFVVNPGDDTTSFYMEGMNAPMGSFGGYGHAARAVTVVDRSLKELEPGVYGAKLRIPAAGRYDVAFLLDAPRVLHCFHAVADLDLTRAASHGKLGLRFLPIPPHVAAGRPLDLAVRLIDPITGQPRAGIEDVTVLYHRTPGGTRRAARAADRGDGLYEARLELDQGGAWFAFVSVPSLEIRPNELPYRGFVVEDPPAPAEAR